NGFVYDSYWNVETSGQQVSAGGGPGPAGKTTAEMFTQITFKYYNFNTLWQIANEYPFYKDLSAYAALEVPYLTELVGTGTANNPYLIHNGNELTAMHQNLEAHYRLTNDIDLSSSVIWNYGKGWLPVGTSTTGSRFKGSLDGNGYAISAMTVNIPNGNNIGLFGYLEQAQIENLKIPDANVQSDNNAGILAGSIFSSELDHIEVSGNITARHTVGGLTSVLNNTQASILMVNSLVKGGNRVGGIAGSISNASALHYAMSYGEVIGNDYVGGLVGEMSTGSPQVHDCYSRAEVTGSDRVGGLAGYIWTGAANNAYSTGLVQGTGNSVGGLVGQGTSAVNCFWDIETSGQTNSSAGVGKTTAEMKTENTFTNAGWDFVEIWKMNQYYNDGYPMLLWQPMVGNKELSDGMDVQLFPNPSNGSFKIQFKEIQAVVQVTVMDVTGKITYRQTFVSTQEIPVSVSSYRSGLHFVRIETGKSSQLIKMILFYAFMLLVFDWKRLASKIKAL
ncbi:MAG: T9SS type A sorting domain-containing protein, partial [Bacteroidales bacterium]|nr:T9SS type A sorting domain-containing protein [Bacteroidales bacterium]